MIVEDEHIVALELEHRLRRMGFDIVGNFPTGEEAVANAAAAAPELVLMDIGLAGEMDGIAAAALLRSEYSIPVVFLTAYADDATVERLKSTEPLGYVLKPFEQRALHATIETALFRRRAELARAEAETARRRAEARYYSTLDNSPDAIISVDLEGKIVVFNRAAERMFGYSFDEARGLPLDTLIPVAVREHHRDHLRRYFASGGAPRAMNERRPMSALRRDGSLFPIEVSISMVDDEQPLHTAVVRDISERVSLEGKLRRSQQAEAVGMLAASVIHDVNNLLTVIQQAAGLVRRRPADHEELVDTIAGAVTRGSALTRQLLLFARQGSVRAGVAELDTTMQRLRDLVEQFTPESVRVVMELGAGVARIPLDRHRLEQIVLNLVANARDAMPLGGVITIRTSVSRERVNIEVADTGSGMPERVLAQMFEPFYTTKDETRGTGLGLWSVREVVESVGGRIDVASRVGEGTTFVIDFPCTLDSPSQPPPPTAVAQHVDATPASILVVEDEDPLRRILVRTLEMQGFHVQSASGAGEALALLERGADGFDVLLTDLVLPIMGGLELAERMRRFLPRLRVLFMSGYGDGMGADLGANMMLAKPFSGDELVASIHQSLVPRGDPS